MYDRATANLTQLIWHVMQRRAYNKYINPQFTSQKSNEDLWLRPMSQTTNQSKHFCSIHYENLVKDEWMQELGRKWFLLQ